MGSQRVRHDWATLTSLHFLKHFHGFQSQQIARLFSVLRRTKIDILNRSCPLMAYTVKEEPKLPISDVVFNEKQMFEGMLKSKKLFSFRGSESVLSYLRWVPKVSYTEGAEMGDTAILGGRTGEPGWGRLQQSTRDQLDWCTSGVERSLQRQ